MAEVMPRRLERAGRWGAIVGGIAFGLGFVPLLIALVQEAVTGESSGNGPILGFLVGPPAFVVGFVGGLLGRDSREQMQ
jgi:hypothetical protein